MYVRCFCTSVICPAAISARLSKRSSYAVYLHVCRMRSSYSHVCGADICSVRRLEDLPVGVLSSPVVISAGFWKTVRLSMETPCILWWLKLSMYSTYQSSLELHCTGSLSSSRLFLKQNIITHTLSISLLESQRTPASS